MENNKDNNEDRFEDFIRQNRDDFDDMPAPTGDWLVSGDKPDRLERFVHEHRSDFDHLEPEGSVWNGVDLPESHDLESYVNNHRSSFDVHEPSAGVWDKIDARLGPEQPVKKQWMTMLWRAASVAAIVLCSVTLLKLYINVGDEPDEQEGGTSIVAVSPELKAFLEAEAYYASEVDNMKQEFDQIAVNHPDIKHEVDYDLEELDQAYLELKEELKEDLHNQDIIEAMIQNYRLKLSILEDMLEQIGKQGITEDEDSRDTFI